MDFVDVDVGVGGASAYDPRVRWTPYAHAPKGVTERSKGRFERTLRAFGFKIVRVLTKMPVTRHIARDTCRYMNDAPSLGWW